MGQKASTGFLVDWDSGNMLIPNSPRREVVWLGIGLSGRAQSTDLLKPQNPGFESGVGA